MSTKEDEKYDHSLKISLLQNALYYFIESVFIIAQNDCYRLVVLHQNKLQNDQTYKTVRGAKIAFQKMYRQKAWKEDVKADWTPFYSPLLGWCEKKMRVNHVNETEKKIP